MPSVSVIVPVFNCEAFLRECIGSALGQTMGDLELILVDDGSTDGSGKIIDGFAAEDRRVVAVHKENGGQSSARNAGLDIASGEYICFMDGDDVMAPALLESVIPKFRDGIGMVVFNSEGVPPMEAGEVRFRSDEEKYAFLAGPFRMRAIRWEVWNRVYRRDIIEKWRIRFPEDRRAYPEDMFFNLCYTAHISRILVIPDVLYSYRRQEGSISGNAFDSSKNLMFLTSDLMAEALGGHYRSCEDCRYIADRYTPLFYLLHKAAIRRLRRFQWKGRLSMQEARNILRENVMDYPSFIRRMREAFRSPVVRESYRKDRGGAALQLTDRLYAGVLLDIPGPGRLLRKALLAVICAARRAFS